ncbi:MAG: ATP-dependent DNA helicase [Oligoflexales bacterium]
MKKIKISITDFALPLVRKGSLSREGSLFGMDIGVQIHKMIQSERGKSGTYKREVPMKHSFATKRFCFEVSGRADGVDYIEPLVVEEIKSTSNIASLAEEIQADEQHPYRLQALTYVYILREATGSDVIANLLLVSVKGDRQISIPLRLDSSYSDWLEQRLAQLEIKERLRQSQIRRRKGVGSTMQFPFRRLRLHQEDLVRSTTDVVTGGGQAMFQAPTGIGKTIAVLFPALQNSLQRGGRSIYVTPKNKQFDVVKEAVQRIEPTSRALKTQILTAKAKLCRKERVDCNAEYCEYARNYYDKFHDNKLDSSLMKYAVVDQDVLLDLAEKFEVCPYYLQMDVLANADLVVGDYNHVFSPRGILKAQIQDLPSKERPNLLVDEAHNLYERAMDYYSPALLLSHFDAAKAWEGFSDQKLKRRFKTWLTKALHAVTSYRPAHGQSATVTLDEKGFSALYAKFYDLVLQYSLDSGEFSESDPVIELFFRWAEFVAVLEISGKETLATYIIEKEGERLKLLCCNPAPHITNCLREYGSSILFSATLKPFEFFRRISGVSDEVVMKEFATPFPDENRKVIVIPQVATTYTKREKHYGRIAEAMSRIAAVQPGNYIAFFPSYAFLESVRRLFWLPGADILVQSRDMTKEQYDEIALRLMSSDQDCFVLAVQGGSLSEGVDFNTPHLKGAFVVGPAVPSLSFERELLRRYYDEKFGEGFSYAYIYPAMTRSIQASGRVIRSDDKRGLIVLMDERFTKKPYTESLPRFWYKETVAELVSQSILREVSEFWQFNPFDTL